MRGVTILGSSVPRSAGRHSLLLSVYDTRRANEDTRALFHGPISHGDLRRDSRRGTPVHARRHHGTIVSRRVRHAKRQRLAAVTLSVRPWKRRGTKWRMRITERDGRGEGGEGERERHKCTPGGTVMAAEQAVFRCGRWRKAIKRFCCGPRFFPSSGSLFPAFHFSRAAFRLSTAALRRQTRPFNGNLLPSPPSSSCLTPLPPPAVAKTGKNQDCINSATLTARQPTPRQKCLTQYLSPLCHNPPWNRLSVPKQCGTSTTLVRR